MSLVDYASSDEEEEIDLHGIEEDKGKRQIESAAPSLASPPPSSPLPPSSVLPPNRRNQNSIVTDQPSTIISLPPPSLEGLPDVSVLLAAPSYESNHMVGDHSSRVAAAIAERASRKRESNGSTFPQPSSKHPRGQSTHPRNVPNTMGGLLVPPQLSGRSNVVTEDVGKLFVSKRGESSR
ncbi:unnamed protein product [Musa acuminata subsp. malaccensis]|uniref:(wild Malaysian banana) hypothetical protein n=1 Tax=Musa acuminata subsp. malaccensis TaxID=214687 RepID=A0A804I9W9_MUSAM|nr:PREDICTED: uncharacterized protein LOC103977699 [Musa acuminata subsp. malaccensis]CAG1849571.1 unnamed protein product [Musa acuminata subsp. malaccensis]